MTTKKRIRSNIAMKESQKKQRERARQSHMGTIGKLRVKPLVWLRLQGILFDKEQRNQMGHHYYNKARYRMEPVRLTNFTQTKETIAFWDAFYPRTVIEPDQAALTFTRRD